MAWVIDTGPNKGKQVDPAQLLLSGSGLVNFDPKTRKPSLNVPRTKMDVATDALGLLPFLYGGPEAAEGASLGARALYRLGRAGLTGAETVGSDLIHAAGNKLQGRPSGITPIGELERFGMGAAAQPLIEGASGLIGRITGRAGADAAAREAEANRVKALAENAAQHRDAALRLGSENNAAHRLRTLLGGSAPDAAPADINRETINSQNAVGHAINTIHRGINDQYERLLRDHKDVELPEGVSGERAASLKGALEDDGRWHKLAPSAQALVNDTIRQGGGLKQTLGYDVDGKPIGATEKILNDHPDKILRAVGYEDPILAGMTKEEMRGEAYSVLGDGPIEIPAQSKPFSAGRALTLTSRAGGILRSGANAESKSAALQISRLLHEQMGDIELLSPDEKLEHERLKGETRAFYNDFGDVRLKGKTPGDIGAKLIAQPPHVLHRIIDAAGPQERASLERAFADSVLPRDGSLETAIPKLAEADRNGTLRKLYPGRYGKLTDWTGTAAAQQRLDQEMHSPAAQAEAAKGMRAALSTPEGRAFMDRMAKLKLKTPDEAIAKLPTGREAAVASLKPGGRGMHFMARYIGIYAPMEALMGYGVFRNSPLEAAAAFTTIAGSHLIFHSALANDAFRERYYRVITNPKIGQVAYGLARLGMGMALEQLRSQSSDSKSKSQ